MAEQQKSVPDIDPELLSWVETAVDETREVIVEARVPQRHVQLAKGTAPRTQPTEVTTDEGPSRAAVLQELQEFLTGVLGSRPRVLSAAGAIPLRVTPNQLRQIVRHPLVKAVRINRRLT